MQITNQCTPTQARGTYSWVRGRSCTLSSMGAVSVGSSESVTTLLDLVERYGVVGINSNDRAARVSLFDHLIGGHEKAHRKTERLRRFGVDNGFELRGCLHGKVGRISSA